MQVRGKSANSDCFSNMNRGFSYKSDTLLNFWGTRWIISLEQYITTIKTGIAVQNVTLQHQSNTSLVFCLAFIFPKVTFILAFQYYSKSRDSFIGKDDVGILWLLKLLIHVTTSNSTNINNHENRHGHRHGRVQMPVAIGLQSAVHCLMGVEQGSPVLSC